MELHRWLHSVYFSFIFNGGLPRWQPQNTAAVPESGARNLRGKAKRWRKSENHKSLPDYIAYLAWPLTIMGGNESLEECRWSEPKPAGWSVG